MKNSNETPFMHGILGFQFDQSSNNSKFEDRAVIKSPSETRSGPIEVAFLRFRNGPNFRLHKTALFVLIHASRKV